MIQRIQSLFLALVTVFLIVSFFFPIWSKASPDGSITIAMTSIKIVKVENGISTDLQSTFFLSILMLAAALLAAYSISKYDNRLTQMKIGALNSLIMAVNLGLMLYFSFQAEKLIPDTEKGNYLVGFYLPAVAMIANVLANRFIRRDEQLVRNSERIR